MTNQPKWKRIANLGDVHPIDHGGYFVYIDQTGVYAPEGEVLEAPDDDSGVWTVYRFSLERCTDVDGVLSDNRFHPEHAAWFAQPEAGKLERPQDSTYLSRVAESIDVPLEILRAAFCHPSPVERAIAYRYIGEYHGYANLDAYPLTLTSRSEARKRYRYQF